MADWGNGAVKLSAFVQYQNKDDNETVYALVLTEPMINVLAITPGQEGLAKAAKPGDFIVAFDNRVVSGEEFREKYRRLT